MSPGSVSRYVGFRPEEISARINEEVVEIHFDEASFLWMLRDRAVLAPNYSLQDLADLDERVEAHVDGLRVAGSFGWELCEKAVESADPGVLFAAGVLALESGDVSRIEAVLGAATSSPEASRGLISAMGWLPFEVVVEHLGTMLDSGEPEVRRIGIAGYAVHRRDPGQALQAACSAEDARLRARAFQAAGELGRVDLLTPLTRSLSDADAEARFCAAWAAARLGNRDAPVIDTLNEIAVTAGLEAERALETAMRALPVDQAASWLGELRRDPERLPLVARGAGAIGNPALVPELINLMRNDEICRTAGEAVTMITGVDLAYLDLDRDAPEDYEGGPTESPEDEEVTLDPDEDLPWPEPDLVAAWWTGEQSKFRPDLQYLWGQPKSEGALREVLRTASQRGRAAAALELGLRGAGPLFEVRAPGKHQLRLL